MRENDVLFFNLHRRYGNYKVDNSGFLGIYILSAVLNDNGWQAQGYAGCLAEGKRLLDEACEEGKVSMIGLYCDYDNITENIFLAHYIKKTYNLPVIVGGPQATALTADFFRKSLCDAVVRYEGEQTVLELTDYFLDGTGSLKAIKGISYLTDDKVIINPEREVIRNLDALPFVNAECYLDIEHYRRQTFGILTGRGCPFHCAFCHEGHHTKVVRFRSPENVLVELKRYLQYFPDEYTHFTIFDDTFTLIPKRVKAICEGIMELRGEREFDWFCEGHVHTLYEHPEMIDYIAKAGCQRIQLGIEAGTQRVLDAYGKNSTLEEIEVVVKKCRDAGIGEVYGNIIIGGAFFDREIFEKDMAFAKHLLTIGEGTVELGVVPYWPLAETTITNRPQDFGIKIIDGDFVTSCGDYPQIETAELDRTDILYFVKKLTENISQYMEYMLKNGLVPEKRILGWFKRKRKGLWWHTLKMCAPNIFSYYELVSLKEGGQRKDLSEEEFGNAHPLRTVALSEQVKFKTEREWELFGYTLSSLEEAVLIFSVGKLSVKEIIGRLKKDERFSELTDLAAEVRKTLDTLERKYFIVYSRF